MSSVEWLEGIPPTAQVSIRRAGNHVQTLTGEELKGDGRLVEDILLSLGSGAYTLHVVTTGVKGGQSLRTSPAGWGTGASHATAANKDSEEMAALRAEIAELKSERGDRSLVHDVLGALLKKQGGEGAITMDHMVEFGKMMKDSGFQLSDIGKVAAALKEFAPTPTAAAPAPEDDSYLQHLVPALGALGSFFGKGNPSARPRGECARRIDGTDRACQRY